MKTIALFICRHFPNLSYEIYKIEEDSLINYMNEQREDSYACDPSEELPF